eukprot:149835_1
MASRKGPRSGSTSDQSGSSSDSSSEESSSDWDVTSSDNDSSDNTTLDIYGGMPLLSPSISMSNSYRSSDYDAFSFADPSDFIGERTPSRNRHYRSQTTRPHNNNRIRSRSHDIVDTNDSTMPERVPFLVKMRSNQQITRAPLTIDETEDTIDDLRIDLGYYLYSLFYPFTNYQALLFSLGCVYRKEKKKRKTNELYSTEEEEEEDLAADKSTQIKMNWNDQGHIERISGLLSRLLKTAGTKGIGEIALYQMFSSPSPQRIIYELRFGLYDSLCLAHLDRFGRRTFYYSFADEEDKDEYHFNIDRDMNVFNEVDVMGLSDFIGDEIDKPLRIESSATQTIKDAMNMCGKPNRIKTKTHHKPSQSVSAHSTPRVKKKKIKKSKKISNKRKRIMTKRTVLTRTVTTTRVVKRKNKGKKKQKKKKSSGTRRNTVNTADIKKQFKKQRPKQKPRKKHVQTRSREEEISRMLSTNYAITSLFKRRLSKQNAMLLDGLRARKIRKYKEKEKEKEEARSPRRRRKRRITIEEMGGDKWCTIQMNHSWLVAGFIRRIKLCGIPLSMVSLCGMFYYCNSHLLLISGSMECKNTKHNQIHILGISNKKRYKIKLNRIKKKNSKKSQQTTATKKISQKTKRSTRDVSLSQSFDRYELGSCFTSLISLSSLPWLEQRMIESSIPIHSSRKYSLIIRSGGTHTSNQNVSKENDLIVFNSKHLYETKKRNSPKISSKPKIINGYYSKLPSFSRSTEYLSVIYDFDQRSLFSFGGLNLDGRCCRSISQLSLTQSCYSDMKWSKCGALKRARYSCSLVVCKDSNIENSKIACLGGLNTAGTELRHVEFYNCSSHECVSGASMKQARSNCGACFVQNLNASGSIIVGGGVRYGDGSKQIELFDAHKNSWNIHAANTNYKHSFPTIWSDPINPNIIYIAGDNIGLSGSDCDSINLGFIEWCDLRHANKNKLFNVLYEHSIHRLWRFKTNKRSKAKRRKYKINNVWESRALFCI